MLTVQGNDFYLNGKKFNIYSGAIHYFRTVPEYWEDRLLKLKAAGFNTVETYVPWNLHEPKKGEFDFSYMLDIERFLKTAESLGLYAIVRPGPYICAEWDFGGLPAWLLKDQSMRVRCCYPPYLEHVKDFFAKLLPMLTPMQITNGGNIIAMQIENEYGSYANDKAYLAYIEKLYAGNGINVLLFTSDGPNRHMMAGGTLPHILKTANFGSGAKQRLQTLRNFQPEGPLMCMEFWIGWFDHWGTPHHRRPAWHMKPSLKYMLKGGHNFNMYMFHGGTNFGFNAGANYHRNFCPTVTSYDYDAPLTEYGGYTKKYHAIRKIMLEHQGVPALPLPAEPELQSIGAVKLAKKTSLLANLDSLGEKHESVTAESMEYFGQNHGLILYEHTSKANYGNSILNLDGLADIAYVYVNKTFKGRLERCKKTSLFIGELQEGDTLSILVDALGRVNYGRHLHDRKGVKRIRIGGQILYGFQVTTIPLDNIEKTDFTAKASPEYPAILKGSFDAKSQKDCFIHLKGFVKGSVWVNGFNLGRYWSRGPQHSLYVPGPILKDKNEVVVLELENASADEILITDKPRLK